jgi:hypothetical protein
MKNSFLVSCLVFLAILIVASRYPNTFPLKFDIPVFEFVLVVVREGLDHHEK